MTPLLAAGVAPPERFRAVLDKLVPRLRRLLGESLVKQKLSESLGAEPAVLGHLMDAGTMDHFLAPEFAESHVSLLMDPTRFPVQFDAFTRLSKGMFIATRLRFTARKMEWYSRFFRPSPAGRQGGPPRSGSSGLARSPRSAGCETPIPYLRSSAGFAA